MAANDPDGDALIYRLGGPDAASFDIDSDTGQVAVRTVLDYETKEEYSVTVTTEDPDGLSASLALTITVTDADEAPATLLERYDTDDSGSIEKSEVIQAINDYLFGEGANAPSKEDVIEVINLYLFG